MHAAIREGGEKIVLERGYVSVFVTSITSKAALCCFDHGCEKIFKNFDYSTLLYAVFLK